MLELGGQIGAKAHDRFLRRRRGQVGNRFFRSSTPNWRNTATTGGVPVILVEHDITFTLYRQLYEADGKPETRREYDRWLEFERESLQCVNEVWTMSHDDRTEAIAYGAAERRAIVIPNGVDLERFMVRPRPDGPPTVLFVGSFRHLPNLLAFELLRDAIMPQVWRAVPEAILHVIAGPVVERAAIFHGEEDFAQCPCRCSSLQALSKTSARPTAQPTSLLFRFLYRQARISR